MHAYRATCHTRQAELTDPNARHLWRMLVSRVRILLSHRNPATDTPSLAFPLPTASAPAKPVHAAITLPPPIALSAIPAPRPPAATTASAAVSAPATDMPVSAPQPRAGPDSAPFVFPLPRSLQPQWRSQFAPYQLAAPPSATPVTHAPSTSLSAEAAKAEVTSTAATALSRCLVCLDEFSPDAFITCSNGHGLCNQCFPLHVSSQCDDSVGFDDMIARNGLVRGCTSLQDVISHHHACADRVCATPTGLHCAVLHHAAGGHACVGGCV